jgi:ABC-type uncharacterized transport system permease subunit
LAGSVGVTVAIPKNIRVQMVDASALWQFQWFGLVASILGSAVVGFFVAWVQTPGHPDHLLIETGIWLLLFALAVAATLKTRKSLAPESP